MLDRFTRIGRIGAGCSAVLALLALVGCGGGGSRNTFGPDDGAAAGPTPNAPVATIAQGFGVTDPLGRVDRVVLNYWLQDSDPGDLVNVLIEVSVRGCADATFTPFMVAPEFPLGSEGVTNLTSSTSSPGQIHTFVIDALAALIGGAGPVDVMVRITPSNDDATGASVVSGTFTVGPLPAQIALGRSQPGVSPSSGNRVPVSLISNGLPVDQVVLVASFTSSSINLSGTPIVLGPAASAAGATISMVSTSPGRIEATIGGPNAIADGVIAFLQFDIVAGATGGSFAVTCVADSPAAPGTRGSFQGQRQCVECSEATGAVLLAGPSAQVIIGSSPNLFVPSSNNCIPLDLLTRGVQIDQVTVTVGYDASAVRPASSPVGLGQAAIDAMALLISVDRSIPGQLTFTVGGGSTLTDGNLVNLCFDVLVTATLGLSPIPCVGASSGFMGGAVPLQCGAGGFLVLFSFNAVINVGDYTPPLTPDPITGCPLSNLGTVGDSTAVSPAISNTVDISLSSLGRSFDSLRSILTFDSNLLRCTTDPLTMLNGGVSLGAAAPPGTVLSAASCRVSGIGPGLGTINFTVAVPGGMFVDGVIARVTFDVPAPSPDAASTPLAPTSAFAAIECSLAEATFRATAPSIACGQGGRLEVRPSCITRECRGIVVFSDTTGDMMGFALPVVNPTTGPIQYDNNIQGSPLILTAVGGGTFSGSDDRDDQKLEVYVMFSEAPFIERASGSSGAIVSAGTTEYFVGTTLSPARGAVSVDAEGLVSGMTRNCCDTIRVVYTPNSVTAVGAPCETEIVACVDSVGPDDINSSDPTQKRNGPMSAGDVDAEIPGLPSGADLATLTGGMGATFDYVLWVHTGTSNLGAYTFSLIYDPAVLSVDHSDPTPTLPGQLSTTYTDHSSMGIPLSSNNPGGTLIFLDVEAGGSTETGIFPLVGVLFEVIGSGSSPLTLSIMSLVGTDTLPIGGLAPGPRVSDGASTAATCPVQFP